MKKNELFRIVDPETSMARVISFDSTLETFYFNMDGDTQPIAAYKSSPEDIRSIVGVFEKTHSGAELLSKGMRQLLEEELTKFVTNRRWENIHELRSAIADLDDLQRTALRALAT